MHFFDRAYEGTPLWEIGGPQPEFVRLEEEGAIVGRVLDLGCGTGETAIYLASRGHPVWGIDIASNAIRQARAKASERGVTVRFRAADVLIPESLPARFDTAVDSGLFHVFLDPHRPLYAENVRNALVPGGHLFLLCFSEDEPKDWGGPRRVSQAEIRETFQSGWELRSIRPAHYEVTLPGVRGKAWLADLRRVPGAPSPAPGPRRVSARAPARPRGSARAGAGPHRHSSG